MAFKEISGNGSSMNYWPKKATERKEGDEVVGVYKTKQTRINPDGSQSVLYILNTDDGLVGVNSSAVIARAMDQIVEGTTVKIVFKGKATSKKTGRSYNDFGVYVDDATDTAPKGDNIDLNSLDF